MKIAKVLKFIMMYLPLLFSPPSTQSLAQARNSKVSTNIIPSCDRLPTECDGFRVEEGEISNSLTILAEYHDRKADTYRCIEALTQGKQEHTIYLEGIQRGKYIDCTEVDLKKKPGRICVGWDDMSAQKQVSMNIKIPRYKAQHLQKLEKISGAKTAAAMDKYIRSQLQKISAFQKLYDPAFPKPKTETERHNLRSKLVNTEFETVRYTADELNGMKSAGHFLLNQRKNGESYKAIFNGLAYQEEILRLIDNMSSKNSEKSHKTTHQRDKAFIAAVKDAAPDSFFIIGKNHLIPSSDGNQHNLQYIRDELRKLADENPYAILSQ